MKSVTAKLRLVVVVVVVVVVSTENYLLQLNRARNVYVVERTVEFIIDIGNQISQENE